MQLKCGGALTSELDALYIFALGHVPGHMTHIPFVQIQRLNPTTSVLPPKVLDPEDISNSDKTPVCCPAYPYTSVPGLRKPAKQPLVEPSS